jgi:hypothetical protein
VPVVRRPAHSHSHAHSPAVPVPVPVPGVESAAGGDEDCGLFFALPAQVKKLLVDEMENGGARIALRS